MPNKAAMAGPMGDTEDIAGMDSLYGEGAPAGGSQETTDQEEAETAEESNTAVVPLKVLMGSTTEPLKEGEEIVVKVVKVYGDEAEIAYSESKPGSIGGSKSDDEEIDSLSSAGPGY